MSFNYIGSKKGLIDFIDIPIKKIIDKNGKNLTFFDGFAGTGIVGQSFHNKYNFKIIANDMEYYSYIINYALLCSVYSDKLEKIINELNTELNDNMIEKNIMNYQLISLNYSLNGDMKRMFWTGSNAMKCDYIVYRIKTMLNNNTIVENEYNFLMASLLSAMDKRANTASVYGAFLKKFKESSIKDLVLIPIHTNKNLNPNNIVFNLDINSDVIYNEQYDICYLDPPYNNRQYSANYFPLNYIAKYGDNLVINDKTKTGLLVNYNRSKYSQSSDALKMFNHLINNLKTKHILLSYNNEGIMKLDDIKKTLTANGKVILYKKVYKKFKSNINQQNEKVYEYLFHLEKSDEQSYNEIVINNLNI
jgi:adenine-specific DNA-methyltransferase